jgi:hypothetical protein
MRVPNSKKAIVTNDIADQAAHCDEPQDCKQRLWRQVLRQRSPHCEEACIFCSKARLGRSRARVMFAKDSLAERSAVSV